MNIEESPLNIKSFLVVVYLDLYTQSRCNSQPRHIFQIDFGVHLSGPTPQVHSGL